jgi:hypothetical protein
VQDLIPGAEVGELLAAIRDALDPPAPVTYEGLEVRARLIASRAAYMAGAIDQALVSGHLPSPVPIRNLAGQALPYQPKGGAS